MSSPSTRPPPSSAPAAGSCQLAVLEGNRAVAARAARVLRAASGLDDVAVGSDPATVRDTLGDDPLLVGCDAAEVEVVLRWATERYPRLRVAAWTSGSMDELLDLAHRTPELVSLVGWPSFASMPRPWELALLTRRIVDAESASPRLNELVPWGSTVTKFRPRTSAERDAVVVDVTQLAEIAGGASPRIAKRVGDVAHEMLMNAMYDAPVDEDGRPRYAHDRKQDLELSEGEVPTFRFATDGVHVALQIVDPFGGLQRRHVLGGIARGRAATKAEGAPLDTSNGGAGLGLYRIYSQSTVLIVDVDPGRFTSVTAFFDLDVNPREARSLPVSLHLFVR